MTEYGHKTEEKTKAKHSEIKENIQGANNERKEIRTQINNLEQKEEMNIKLEQNEETRIQKNEERLRNLWDNIQTSNIQIKEMSEGEKEEQEIENLFEQIMKGNVPNLSLIHISEPTRPKR